MDQASLSLSPLTHLPFFTCSSIEIGEGALNYDSADTWLIDYENNNQPSQLFHNFFTTLFFLVAPSLQTYTTFHEFALMQSSMPLRRSERHRCRFLELPAEVRVMIYQHTQRTIIFRSSIFHWPNSVVRVRTLREGGMPRFKQITIEYPSTMLRSTCSFIRKEYQCFFKTDSPTFKIDYTWFFP